MASIREGTLCFECGLAGGYYFSHQKPLDETRGIALVVDGTVTIADFRVAAGAHTFKSSSHLLEVSLPSLMNHFRAWAANQPQLDPAVRDGLANFFLSLGRGVGRWCPAATLSTAGSIAWNILHVPPWAMLTPAQYAAEEERAGCAVAAIFAALASTAAVAKHSLGVQLPALDAVQSYMEDADASCAEPLEREYAGLRALLGAHLSKSHAQQQSLVAEVDNMRAAAICEPERLGQAAHATLDLVIHKLELLAPHLFRHDAQLGELLGRVMQAASGRERCKVSDILHAVDDPASASPLLKPVHLAALGTLCGEALLVTALAPSTWTMVTEFFRSVMKDGAKAQLDPGLALFIDAGPRVLEALHCTRTNARLLAGLSAHADLGLAAGETSFNAAAGALFEVMSRLLVQCGIVHVTAVDMGAQDNVGAKLEAELGRIAASRRARSEVQSLRMQVLQHERRLLAMETAKLPGGSAPRGGTDSPLAIAGGTAELCAAFMSTQTSGAASIVELGAAEGGGGEEGVGGTEGAAAAPAAPQADVSPAASLPLEVALAVQEVGLLAVGDHGGGTDADQAAAGGGDVAARKQGGRRNRRRNGRRKKMDDTNGEATAQ